MQALSLSDTYRLVESHRSFAGRGFAVGRD
jgi:hypothetical protein